MDKVNEKSINHKSGSSGLEINVRQVKLLMKRYREAIPRIRYSWAAHPWRNGFATPLSKRSALKGDILK